MQETRTKVVFLKGEVDGGFYGRTLQCDGYTGAIGNLRQERGKMGLTAGSATTSSYRIGLDITETVGANMH